MIKVFTPGFADEANTNAQNLTVKEIVARLDPNRFQVSMLYSHRPDPRITSRPNTRLRLWWSHGNTLRHLARLLMQPPDVYFFPREGSIDAAFFSLRRHLDLRTAIVTYIVSGGLAQDGIRPTLASAMREADVVIGNNRALSAFLAHETGLSVPTIYDGVDTRYFFPPGPGWQNESLVVLYAGSFRVYKRAEAVIRQAARWPSVEFRLAGHGEEQARCRQLAEQLNCRNVRFVGHLDQPGVGEEMRRADVFLFPSVIEGHPQVLLQAAGCGLPCVARNSYQPDYVRDGDTGFLVGSEEELAAKLDLLITDHELRRSMGVSAAQHAQQFTWEGAARDWERIFEKAVEHRRRVCGRTGQS